MALYFECQINKNALLQTAFLAILPTGLLCLLGNNGKFIFLFKNHPCCYSALEAKLTQPSSSEVGDNLKSLTTASTTTTTTATSTTTSITSVKRKLEPVDTTPKKAKKKKKEKEKNKTDQEQNTPVRVYYY